MSTSNLIGCLLCILLLACGGLTRERLYRPVVPTDSETRASYGRSGDVDEWRLALDESELVLFPVKISEKLLWVFGPLVAFPVFFLEDEVPNEGALVIRVIAEVDPGDVVEFDTREFTVELEGRRSLSPRRSIRSSQPDDTRFEATGPVRLSGVSWRRDLEYDVLVSDLGPFALQLGSVSVNGVTIHPPPIRFVRDKRYSGS